MEIINRVNEHNNVYHKLTVVTKKNVPKSLLESTET